MPRLARATTEPAAVDARAMGMGGTGIAYTTTGAHALYNPATLESVRNITSTVNLVAGKNTPSAPFFDPATMRATQQEGVSEVSPLFLVSSSVAACVSPSASSSARRCTPPTASAASSVVRRAFKASI